MLGRVLSGVGFAASFGLSFALLRAIALEPDALARSVAKWLALQTLAIVLLCVAGGYLAGVNWRAAYLVGPAVGVLALVWSLKVVPEARDPAVGRFDAVGLVLVAVGLVSALYAVSNAASAGWVSARVLIPLLAGLVVLIAFGVWEWRSANPAFPIRSSQIRKCWSAPCRASASTSAMPSLPFSSRCCGNTSTASSRWK